MLPEWVGEVKHVICEGARFHVISWSNLGSHCSEARCEINRPRPTVADERAAWACGEPDGKPCTVPDCPWCHANPSHEGRRMREYVVAIATQRNEAWDDLARLRDDLATRGTIVEAEQRDEIARLRTALVQVVDYAPEWTDGDLPDHSDCAECARRRGRNWPPSQMCEDLYSAVARRDDVNRRSAASQHWRMRDIARAALTPQE